MIFIDKLNIFIFCALSLAGYMQARSIFSSQIGDIRIQRTDDKWICDQIECPPNSYRCYVSKSNEKDSSVLVRTNICYSKDNKPLADKVTSTSVDPNSKINVVVNSDSNGVTSTSEYNSNTKFDDKKFQEEMTQLESNWKDMSMGIQTNIRNEMKRLEESLSNMQYHLDHMFD